MTRALLFAAVSKDDNDQDPENQLRPLRDLAERRAWEVPPDAELAFKQSRWDAATAREIRNAIEARIQRGDIDILAVWSLDRVNREGVLATFGFLNRLEFNYGIRFFSLQEPFLNTDADPEQRELLLPIIAWIAKWESERKSKRLIAKVRTRRALSTQGQATWGGGKIATRPQVDDIHRRAAAGESERSIAGTVGVSRSQVNRILKGQVKSLESEVARSSPPKDDPSATGGA